MQLLAIQEKILYFVCGFGILQGVLLSLLIYFHPRSDRRVNLYLGLYILFTSGVMLLPIAMRIIGWQHSAIALSISYCTGPLLYFYLRSCKETISWRMVLPHFLPFVCFAGLSAWNLAMMGERYPDSSTVPAEVLNRPLTIFLTLSKPVQQICYYFLSRRVVSSYQRSIRQLFSDTSGIDMNWARFLLNGFLILVLAFVVIFALMMRYPDYFDMLLVLNMCLGVPYIYLACYKGVLQSTIWQVKGAPPRAELEKEINEVTRIANESRDRDTQQNHRRFPRLVEDISSLMEDEKIFQEPELTLSQLADRLRVPAYLVSQAINEGMNKTFYDLVNEYRVTEAKRLLRMAGNRQFTILSIGFEAGFNSKTTFNTVFKKFTGQTPSEYRAAQVQAVLS